MNKILIGSCFGIGNNILKMPLIKALKICQPQAQIDVLIGNTPDDIGALDVMNNGRRHGWIDNVYLNNVSSGTVYDVAIMALPHDGRWQCNRDFRASTVMDGRSRPDPNTTGLSSWKQHEVLYMMENARNLGYLPEEIPDASFLTEDKVYWHVPNDYFKTIYLGLGYKKDVNNFWQVKHWGNENYAQFLRLLFLKYPQIKVVTTGDLLDLNFCIKPIMARLQAWGLEERFQYFPTNNLQQAFSICQSCFLYIGNDSGFAHVAGASGNKTITIYNLQYSVTKNHVWSPRDRRIELEGWKEPVSIDQVLEAVEKMYEPE